MNIDLTEQRMTGENLGIELFRRMSAIQEGKKIKNSNTFDITAMSQTLPRSEYDNFYYMTSQKYPDASNREISRTLGKGFSTDTVNRAVKKINAARQARASREKVVEVVSSPELLSERIVNQVVVITNISDYKFGGG